MSSAIAITANGAVEGIARAGHLEFRGIPYAQAPVGEYRYLAPRPHPGWTGTRKAQVFAAPAPQELSPVMGIDRVSDDCLYLNVWTPALDGARRPVLVWLHGGGFLSGCGHQSLYHGGRLAAARDCVVVTCNYRLGLFGFGNLADALGADFPAVHNAGLRDQVAVLEWVRDNIAAFGGDPGCVTLFGESAGGMSVATLLAVPAARGLFQRAIVQSGGADFVVSRDDAARVANAATDSLGAACVDTLLRGEVHAVVRAQRQAVKQTVLRGLRPDTPQFGMTLMPVVDGDFLPVRPIDAVMAGAARDIPLLASVTRDEWNLFVHQPQFAGGRNQKAEQLDDIRLAQLFERALPGRGASALACYRQVRGRKDNGLVADLLCWMESDRMFRVPTQRLLDAQAAHQSRVWGAQFEWECPQFAGVLGACHVVDVPFVFGGTDGPAGQFFTGGGASAAALAETVMDGWTSFARDGIPQLRSGDGWPAWQGGRVLRFGAVNGPGRLLDDGLRAFWDFLA